MINKINAIYSLVPNNSQKREIKDNKKDKKETKPNVEFETLFQEEVAKLNKQKRE